MKVDYSYMLTIERKKELTFYMKAVVRVNVTVVLEQLFQISW